MWMLPIIVMCGSHRSGEHNEIHKHLPDLYRGVRIDGRVSPVVQIQLNALQRRHDELAETLNHKSPLWVDEYLIWRNYPYYYDLEVDFWHNVRDLAQRCPDCRALMTKYSLIKEKDYAPL